MGQYLSIGLCTKIAVEKQNITNQKFTLNEVVSELNKKFEMSSFVLDETNGDYFVWYFNKDNIKQEMYNFLSKIYSDYGVKDEEVLEKIKQITTADEILNIAENERSENFRLDRYSEYDYINLGKFDNYQDINTTYISLFMEGKISMECYDDIFSFFRKTMRQVYSEFKLSGALNVYITG